MDRNAMIPFVLDVTELILGSTGTVVLRNHLGRIEVHDVSPSEFSMLWSQLDGKRTMREVCDAVEPMLSRDRVEEILLAGEDIFIAFRDAPSSQEPIAIALPNQTHYHASGEVLRKPGGWNRIGVIGGGTAGYLTALAFKSTYPDLEVTLVESSSVPVIGVGEATTPLIVDFLHRVLRFDKQEFYRLVEPTWKQGIHFIWGKSGDYSFENHFGVADIITADAIGGGIGRASLLGRLMEDKRGMILRTVEGYRSLLDQLPYAYHIENRKFIGYLKRKATEYDIRYLDLKVTGADLDGETGFIRSLSTEEAGSIDFDLYVDCTGFRSLLLEKQMGSPFIPFDSSLFTDTAFTFETENHGNPEPYTIARSMPNGWMWGIPLRDGTHHGYVHSSSHVSREDAIAQIREVYPQVGDVGTVKFRSGRHTDFWKGNVVAIGNSYGFVEPLQSTGIHMIIEEITTLLQNFPAHQEERAPIALMNRRIGEQWDYLRWFLSIHYKFNHKFDSQFWRDCRSMTNSSGMDELVALYRETGPLSAIWQRDPSMLSPLIHDRIFGAYGLDFMLLGQGLRYGTRFNLQFNKESWGRQAEALGAIVSRAMPMAECLAVLDQHPALLDAASIRLS